MPKLLNIVIFIIGVFEFISTAKVLFMDPSALMKDHKVFPSYYFTDFKTKVLFCTYLMTLGFHRVSWATGGQSFGAWLCLIGTHVVESIMLWTLALETTHNKENLPPVEFIKQLVQGKAATPFDTFVLIFVPVLVVILLIRGPPAVAKKSKTK